MQNLPPGWSISNSTGSFSGPTRPDDDEKDGDEMMGDPDSDLSEHLDIQPDSPGWEDVEPDADVESLRFQCLICPETFNEAGRMLDHCRSEHSFDFLEIRRLQGLDFYSTIKLINYIRLAVKNGSPPDVPDLADPSVWADDRFLQPILENDALLFSLDELVKFEDDDGNEATGTVTIGEVLHNGHPDP